MAAPAVADLLKRLFKPYVQLRKAAGDKGFGYAVDLQELSTPHTRVLAPIN